MAGILDRLVTQRYAALLEAADPNALDEMGRLKDIDFDSLNDQLAEAPQGSMQKANLLGQKGFFMDLHEKLDYAMGNYELGGNLYRKAAGLEADLKHIGSQMLNPANPAFSNLSVSLKSKARKIINSFEMLAHDISFLSKLETKLNQAVLEFRQNAENRNLDEVVRLQVKIQAITDEFINPSNAGYRRLSSEFRQEAMRMSNHFMQTIQDFRQELESKPSKKAVQAPKAISQPVTKPGAISRFFTAIGNGISQFFSKIGQFFSSGKPAPTKRYLAQPNFTQNEGPSVSYQYQARSDEARYQASVAQAQPIPIAGPKLPVVVSEQTSSPASATPLFKMSLPGSHKPKGADHGPTHS